MYSIQVTGQENESYPWRDSPTHSPGTPTPPHTPHPQKIIKPPPGIPVAQNKFTNNSRRKGEFNLY